MPSKNIRYFLFIMELALSAIPQFALAAEPWPAFMNEDQARAIISANLDRVPSISEVSQSDKVKCSAPEERDTKVISETPTEQEYVATLISNLVANKDSVQTGLELARKKRLATGADICGLTAHEVAALSFYTSAGSSFINPALRRKDPKEIKRWDVMIRLIQSALEKLAPYEGVVRRGATYGPLEIASNTAGAWVSLKSFISTSMSYGFGGPDQILYYSHSCRDISLLSNFPEAEVLCRPGMKFLVRYAVKVSGINKYLLEEIHPQLLRNASATSDSFSNLATEAVKVKTKSIPGRADDPANFPQNFPQKFPLDGPLENPKPQAPPYSTSDPTPTPTATPTPAPTPTPTPTGSQAPSAEVAAKPVKPSHPPEAAKPVKVKKLKKAIKHPASSQSV